MFWITSKRICLVFCVAAAGVILPDIAVLFGALCRLAYSMFVLSVAAWVCVANRRRLFPAIVLAMVCGAAFSAGGYVRFGKYPVHYRSDAAAVLDALIFLGENMVAAVILTAILYIPQFMADRSYTNPGPVVQPLCAHCGYSRKGLPISTPCPECGYPNPNPEHPRQPRTP